MNHRPRPSAPRAPSSPARPALAVLVASSVALAVLVRAASPLGLPSPAEGWQEWLGRVGAVTAALSLLRPVALALAAYLVLVSGLALVASALRWRGGLRLVRAIAAGPLKDLAPRAAAVAVSVTGVAVLGAGPVGARTLTRNAPSVVVGGATPSAPAGRAPAPGPAGDADASQPAATTTPPTSTGDERLVRLPDEPDEPSAPTGPTGPSGDGSPPTTPAGVHGPVHPSAASGDAPGRATLALEDDGSPSPIDGTAPTAPSRAEEPRRPAPPESRSPSPAASTAGQGRSDPGGVGRPAEVPTGADGAPAAPPYPEAQPARPVRVLAPPAHASAASASDGGGAAPSTWTVRPGDHLWGMAVTALTRSTGSAPSDAAVIPYWRSLIEANRDRLVDPANPDLILPGQVLVLPPVPG